LALNVQTSRWGVSNFDWHRRRWKNSQMQQAQRLDGQRIAVLKEAATTMNVANAAKWGR